MRAWNKWLALAPFLVIAGCSSFQQPPRPATSGSALSLSAADANLGEALAHYSQGLISEASSGASPSASFHFRQAAALDPSQIPVSLKVASDYIGRRDYTGAVSVLTSLQTAHPDSFEIRLLLGAVYQVQGNRDKAVSCFQSVIRMEPERSEGYIRLASLLAVEFDSRKALAVIRKGLRNVKDPQPLLEFCETVGRLFVAGKDIRGAIPFFEQALVYKSDNETVREALARCYVMAGQEQKALVEFEVLQKKKPDNPQLAIWIGELYEMLGKKGKACESYALALKGDSPEVPIASLRKANLEIQTDPRLALTTLRDALKRFPGDIGLRVYWACLHMQLGKYGEAVNQFDEVAQLVVQDESRKKLLPSLFYYWYGSACERVGRTEVGEQHLVRYLAENPESGEVLNYLAYLWADRGVKLDQAETYIAKALRSDPDNGAYLDTLGWIQYKQGDYSHALKSLERALRKGGEDPVVLDHLGEVCMALKKPEQAIRWWMRSLKVSPLNAPVRDKLIKAGVDASRLGP